VLVHKIFSVCLGKFQTPIFFDWVGSVKIGARIGFERIFLDINSALRYYNDDDQNLFKSGY
jgi:hypothetical protein